MPLTVTVVGGCRGLSCKFGSRGTILCGAILYYAHLPYHDPIEYCKPMEFSLSSEKLHEIADC